MIGLDTIHKDFHSIVVDDGGASITVDAVNLDIRDLAFATDKVDVTGSEVSLDAGTLAALESITVQNGAGAAAVNIQDGGNSITVDGSVSISGNVTVDQGTSPWVVGDGGGSLTVDAVNLDIRDLAFATDKVDVGGSQLAGFFAEDAAHTSGDIGAQMLAVRRDANTSLVGTDGDYAPLQVGALGALKVGMFDAAGDQLAINADGSINVQTVEGGYGNWKVSTETVGLTEVQLVSTPLAGRLRIEITNEGTKDVWIREATGVSTGNGRKIAKGATWEQGLDAGANIFAISDGASATLKVAEYAA